ncbi:unnamed protein product [Ectocarpus sp. 12 AP-2014]
MRDRRVDGHGCTEIHHYAEYCGPACPQTPINRRQVRATSLAAFSAVLAPGHDGLIQKRISP